MDWGFDREAGSHGLARFAGVNNLFDLVFHLRPIIKVFGCCPCFLDAAMAFV